MMTKERRFYLPPLLVLSDAAWGKKNVCVTLTPLAAVTFDGETAPKVFSLRRRWRHHLHKILRSWLMLSNKVRTKSTTPTKSVKFFHFYLWFFFTYFIGRTEAQNLVAASWLFITFDYVYPSLQRGVVKLPIKRVLYWLKVSLFRHN